MTFNFDSPYIEDESEEIPSSLFEIHGVRKIEELSQQLQALQNFKTAIIRFRFYPKHILSSEKKDEEYEESNKNLEKTYSKFKDILKKIDRKSKSIEVVLKNLVNSVIITEDKRNKHLLSNLKDVTEQFFTVLHNLSETEIFLHPNRLKSIVKLTQEACIVNKIINSWSSKFYEELEQNYLQLDRELTILIPVPQAEKHITKTLEEGLKIR